MKITVIGAGVEGGPVVEPGVSPIVITSRDGDDGGIQVPVIEQLVRQYILLEE